MFNLERAIAEWRHRMEADGITRPEVLDELETHLRDEVEEQTRQGRDAEEAFNAAVEQMGQAAVLRAEFVKLAGAASGSRRAFKALLFLGFILVFGISSAYAFLENQAGLGIKILMGAAFIVILLSAWARRYAWMRFPFLPNDPAVSQALETARAEALCFHHDFIGTEHLLLGLLGSEQGTVPRLLRSMRVNREAVRREIEALVGTGGNVASTHALPQTPRLKRALGLAAKEAKASRQTCVSPEHALLGLILEGDGVAARVLEKLGVRIERLREEIQAG